METKYSSIIKDLMKKPLKLEKHILFISIMAMLLGGAIFSYFYSANEVKEIKKNIKEFDAVSEAGGYYQFKPMLLTEPFAAEYDDSINYSFALDEEYIYIVAIGAEDMDKYQEIIEYTYSDEVIEPEAVVMKGISTEIPESILDMAIEYYNFSIDEEFANRENYQFIFGQNYLDTTKKPAINYEIILLLAILFLVVAYFYHRVIKTTKAKVMLTERTLERYSDSYLMDVDTELMMPDVISFPKQKLYFTENYLVCSTNGFNIVPWDEIEQIYGMAFKKLGKDYRSIVVKINDDVDYEIVSTKFDKEGEDLFDQIMSYIYNRKPEIKYGFDDGFYIETVSGFSMEALIGETEAGIRNNYLLGILGAILWSFVGVIIWIAIGKLGLIAGIAGYLMMKFAIYGYRRFSGGINRKGKIISLLISLLMIFVANYLLYVIEMSTYYYGNVFSITNIIKSIVNLPGFLSFTNLWGDFVKDLVIGYGLSLWAGFQIIKEVFRR